MQQQAKKPIFRSISLYESPLEDISHLQFPVDYHAKRSKTENI